MKWFNIDYNILPKLLIKKVWQEPKRMAGIAAILWPVRMLYNAFIVFFNNIIYELAHTSQVVYIEAVLNDRFDAGLRRIKIIDAPLVAPISLFRNIEQRPLYIRRNTENAPKWLRVYKEMFPSGIQFTIEIPVSITYDEKELIALVRKYCLPGRAFMIKQV
ncbi:hypothetical protein CAP35_13695 [Chitinophagaceae bacterium IBVUCB1]|nr:hypothetical protein CAP35_13695 [Chitinophagaceae bacterium IBVUCB1]